MKFTCAGKNKKKRTDQDPSQNELASFMSSHIPEYSTPAALQLRSASAHHASVPFANQSGKTYACEEGSDEASSPGGQYAVRAGALRITHGVPRPDLPDVY